MLNERDIKLIEAIAAQQAAKVFEKIVEKAARVSQYYADKSPENIRYNEIDYRTCELLIRQAREAYEDSPIDIEAFMYEQRY